MQCSENSFVVTSASGLCGSINESGGLRMKVGECNSDPARPRKASDHTDLEVKSQTKLNLPIGA